jgi:hypothetical protein
VGIEPTTMVSETIILPLNYRLLYELLVSPYLI